MTTFEGKSASYVAGKVPINKEALYTGVGKKLLEDLYIVHRRRVLNVEKTVDDRVRVLDFLTDTSWKMVRFSDSFTRKIFPFKILILSPLVILCL